MRDIAITLFCFVSTVVLGFIADELRLIRKRLTLIHEVLWRIADKIQ